MGGTRAALDGCRRHFHRIQASWPSETKTDRSRNKNMQPTTPLSRLSGSISPAEPRFHYADIPKHFTRLNNAAKDRDYQLRQLRTISQPEALHSFGRFNV